MLLFLLQAAFRNCLHLNKHNRILPQQTYPSPLWSTGHLPPLRFFAVLRLPSDFATRGAALVLAGFSVAAAITFHNNFGDPNQIVHFMKNIAIAGGMLQVVAFGPGGFALGNNAKEV